MDSDPLLSCLLPGVALEPSGGFLVNWGLAADAVGLRDEAEEDSVWLLVGCIQ